MIYRFMNLILLISDLLLCCLCFFQPSVIERVTGSGVGLGQSGNGSADDVASPGDGCPWRPAQRPPQIGGGVRSSSGPRWTGRRCLEGGGTRSHELTGRLSMQHSHLNNKHV